MLVISENGFFCVSWNFLNVCLSIVSSYYYIILAYFGDNHNENSYIGLDFIFEVFFFVTMMLRFITDYTEEGDSLPVKSIPKIAKRYLYSYEFILDLAPQIPFRFMFKKIGRNVKLFLIIKVIRMIKGL